jgi:hypothetical protein
VADRRLVSAAGSALGAALAWGGFAALWSALPPPAGDPLRLSAALLALPAAAVLAASLAVMLARYASGAFDPLAAPAPRPVRLAQRILSNTVEQAAVLAPLLLACGALADPAHAGGLAAAAWLWTAGRVLFAAGYALHPMARAPGMSMTVNVSLGLLAYALWRALA